MKNLSHINFSSIFGKVMLLLFFVFASFGLSACDGNKNISISLSNSGQTVVLYLEDDQSTSETVIVEVNADDGVDRRVNVTSNNPLIHVETEFLGGKKTEVTLTAYGVCQNAIVTVTTVEGSKSASFYVNVELPVGSIYATTSQEELYVVKGESKMLNASKLVQFSPANTTQKGIEFSLVESASGFVTLSNNTLFVHNDYDADQILIKATSTQKEGVSTILTLDVLEPISQIVEFSAHYAQTANEVDLTGTISLAKNKADNSSVEFVINVASSQVVSVLPYLKSTVSAESEIAEFVSRSITQSGGVTRFAFTLNAKQVSGSDSVYFVVKYDAYNYTHKTQEFDIQTFDAIKFIQVLANGLVMDSNTVVVYDQYFGNEIGLEISAIGIPTSIDESQKTLVLKIQTNAEQYAFFKKNAFGHAEEIVFSEENTYEFQSGDKFFVKAKTLDAQMGTIQIYAKSNPSEDLAKTIFLHANKGTSQLDITGTQIDQNGDKVIYLSSNEAMSQNVTFFIDNDEGQDIAILSGGSAFTVDKHITKIQANYYSFKISSVKGKTSDDDMLVIRSANGYSSSVRIEVFEELLPENISLTVPTPQHSASVGNMKVISSFSNMVNLQFSAAIKQGMSVSLTRDIIGATAMTYAYSDWLLENFESAYDSDYQNFGEARTNWAELPNLNYSESSAVVQSSYLLGFGEIYGLQAGKTCIQTTIYGYKLENGLKQPVSSVCYFFIEVYVPVETFELSNSSLYLYSAESLGYGDKAYSVGSVDVILNKDATYNQIEFWGDYGFDYVLNGTKVYNFAYEDGKITFNALSTLESFEENGETKYRTAQQKIYYFVAKITEFNKTYTLTLKVDVKKAQQVEEIVVLDVNLDNGIYLQLDGSQTTITRPVTAQVKIGQSGVEPFNSNLVYEFLPDAQTASDALSINAQTGLITVDGSRTHGGAGIIRVAPADRYSATGYNPGEKDVAVYINITVADGNSRETAFRITSLNGITELDKHYVLMNDASLTSNASYMFSGEFTGGLYGALPQKTNYASIYINKTLFETIGFDGVVADLIIADAISGNASVAKTNNGLINNVTFESYDKNNNFNKLTSTSNSYVGGIVAENFGTIQNSKFFGAITANNSVGVGGIAGFNSGKILNCSVELYNFKSGNTTSYAQIIGSTDVGGLVGKMTDGDLKNSYVYSYASQNTPKEFVALDVLKGTAVGAIVGNLTGGLVDITFAFVNDISAFTGNQTDLTLINHAYVMYYEDNNTVSASYIDNYTSKTAQNLIFGDIWQVGQNQNYGHPYFKGLLQEIPLDSIASTLANTDKIISSGEKSIVFFYDTEHSLSLQEKFAIDDLNYLSFAQLLGTNGNLNGLRAESSDASIISVSANGIQICGEGVVSLTLFSKYDYTINQTFEIYAIYPIIDFSLIQNGVKFGDNSSLNIRTNVNFGFMGLTQNSMILDKDYILLQQNTLTLDFQDELEDYISGKGLTITINTSKYYEDFECDLLEVNYELNVQNQAFSSADLKNINDVLTNKYFGKFYLNFFKGADKLEISTSEFEIEPSDEIVFEGYILSDLAKDDENLVIEVLSAEFGEVFDVEVQYLNSVYYTSKTDLNQTTSNQADAVYFKHNYRIKLTVSDQFKNYDFSKNIASLTGQSGTQISLTAYAQSSKQQNLTLVGKNFDVIINSQSVTSINAMHYALLDKNLVYDSANKTNIVYYTYAQNASSVLSPNEEGLLKVNLFPDYASYDYLDVTFSVQNGAVGDIRFGLMSLQNNGNFVRHTKNYTSLDNGIRVLNSYTLENSNKNNQNIIYLSTYIPNTIENDIVFDIAFNVVKDGQVIKTITCSLIVQYLEGADIQIFNQNGKEVDNVARGTANKLVITLEKDQVLESLTFEGKDNSSNDVENYITYANQTIQNLASSIYKTYTYDLYVGNALKIENNANYVTIKAVISWIINGQQQTKTTSLTLGVVDFIIDEITLLTDKINKTNLNTYIGLETKLQFDFNGNQNRGGNDAFNKFLSNYYYESRSELNSYGNYVVNTDNIRGKSFIQNLYYINGDGSTTSVVANDGTITQNSYFTIKHDEQTGDISITGVATTSSAVRLMFKLPVQYPNAESRYYLEELAFEFTVTVVKYSDEDTPLIIENEAGFYDALAGNTPENYILMTDLYLTNYTPRSTASIKSLDGNNHTINIISWDTSSPSVVDSFALFDRVEIDTTLKNLTVNTYHASTISVNTSVTQTINVAGLAITNYGTIYNCEVVAYKANINAQNIENAGIVVSYSTGNITSSMISYISGFVVFNEGEISNSRVGGSTLHKVNASDIALSNFAIAGQGNIAGFVYENRGKIASSYFANGSITNNTASGIETRTSGFVSSNTGSIYTSYAKGIGSGEFSLSGGGITTSSVSAGFVYSNRGNIGDCYSNIMLTTVTNSTSAPYESGRFTAGFAYTNAGEIQRCYTASKIENAKNTQTAFLGVDENNQKLNTGTIQNSYYYASSVLEGDSYTDLDQDVSIKRISEPDNTEYFYGFAFSDNANSVNGVWYSTAYGVELVSANQIAISNRYLANVTRNDATNEIESYNLPYTSGYEYGSVVNPIIIRSADEYNLAFGGVTTLNSSAVAEYRTNSKVFGNYRIISDINFADVATQTVGKIGSSDKSLDGGILDGNMFSLSGVDLTASADASLQNYGLFAKLQNNASIMNMQVNVVLVSASKAQNVGVVAGSVFDSKLVNITLSAGSQTSKADVTGRNIVGGLAGIVQGNSEVKNITATNISVTAEYKVATSSQSFSRNSSEILNLNGSVSYAGGIIGVADIYGLGYDNTYTYDPAMTQPSLLFLKTKGVMIISGSTAGGVVGYLGPRTYLKDATLELSAELGQKIISDKFYAGGIVGENYGDLDMLRAEHEHSLQQKIENNIPVYYKNPASTEATRGNINLFESTSQNKPLAIGGLVGLMATGEIYHAYSKVNVVSKYATYAGGVIGQISGLLGASKYPITLNEVYAFGDVKASQEIATAGAGGIVGFVDFNRKLTFNKVNAVNFWGLEFDAENQNYYIPQNTYSVFAVTGSTLLQNYVKPEYISNIAILNGDVVEINEGYKNYDLPNITCAVGSDDMFAVTDVKFTHKNQTNTITLKKSFAKLNTGAYYDMIQSTQQITPLFELSATSYNGVTMDQYFLQSDWDPNYWVRYTTELLPKLVMFSDTNLFYIDKASDLQKIVQYPHATFIVRAAESPEKPIINVGSYLSTSGIDLSSIVFTGVLKGLDSSMSYGFNFGGLAVPFFESTQNAKIYNLTFKNLGSSNSSASATSKSIVNNAVLTSFENLIIENCHINALSGENFKNVGILANTLSGGYVANISFVNCSVTAVASGDLDELNVGFMAGKIESRSSAHIQIADVTSYMSTGNINSSQSKLNDIVILPDGNNIQNLAVGGIAGKTDGSVMLTYTNASASTERNKGVGVSKTTEPIIPDTSFDGINNGLVIEVGSQNTPLGNIENYNAGLMVGLANNLTISFQRISTASKLYVVGGFESHTVTLQDANVGGLVGKSETGATITNSASVTEDAFVVVDADIALTAQNANAGMLIGSASSVDGIDNIQTYGTINIIGQANIGGFVGSVNNSSLQINDAISRTAITYSNDGATNYSNIGGLVGLFNSTSSLVLGDAKFDTKYLGKIVIDASTVNVGGIVGGIAGSSKSLSGVYAVEITGTVFGGEIVISGGNQHNVGGIVGNTKISGNYENKKTLTKTLSYGSIDVATEIDGDASYFGGIIGKGSTATYLNTNYSVCTMTSKSGLASESMNINAVAGTSNGSHTEANQTNFYSNQVTLCLDNNLSEDVDGLLTENIYYRANNSTNPNLPTMLGNGGVLTDYKAQLSDPEKATEIFDGSKINPHLLSASTYANISQQFDTNDTKRKYFVLTENLGQNVMTNKTLKNAHFIGDGFELMASNNAIFESIDKASVVAGLKVKANITNSNSSVYSQGAISKTGAGTLANVNYGKIYACNVVEIEGQKQDNYWGISNTFSNVYTGGIVGVNGGQILDSTTDIDVKSSSYAGALVGFNNGTIINSYTTGSVTANEAYAFAQGTANGKIYSSYTSATAVNTSSDCGSGVFGDNTVQDSYFDIYATGTNDAKGTMSNTNTMATMVAVTADAPKQIFLKNQNAELKFGYDITTNSGYLSFSGEAYKNFPYLKNQNTGDGTQNNGFMIKSVGKLQQLNTMSTAKYYDLVRDLKISSDIKAIDSDSVNKYGVKLWNPIGLSSTAFIGTFNGNEHTLTNITENTLSTSNYTGIFGKTENATIKNLSVVNNIEISSSASNFSAVVALANGTTVQDVVVTSAGMKSTASKTVNLGAIVAEANGLTGVSTIITDCQVITSGSQISYTIESAGSGSAIGALVGKSSSGVNINSTETYTMDEIKFSYGSSNSASIGSICGNAGKGTISNIKAGKVTIDLTASSTSSFNVGGLLGKADGVAMTDFGISELNITVAKGSSSNLGGLVGLSMGETQIGGDNVVALGNDFKITHTSGSANIGGVVGSAEGSFSGTTNFKNIKLGTGYTFNTNGGNIGAVVGQSSSNISDIETSDTTDTTYTFTTAGGNVGAVAGSVTGGTISSCKISSAINATSTANDTKFGAVVGSISGGTLASDNSVAKSTFTNTGSGTSYMGGIAGEISGGTIDALTAGAGHTFTHSGKGACYMGGVAGAMSGGSVGATAGNNLIFKNSDGEKNDTKSANHMGGVVGKFAGGSFTAQTATGTGYTFTYEESGTSYMGGLFGEVTSSGASVSIDPSDIKVGGKQTFTYTTTAAETNDCGICYMGGIVAKGNNATIAPSSNYTVTVPNFVHNSNDGVGRVYYGGVAGTLSNSTVKNIIVDSFNISDFDKATNYLGGVASTITDSTLENVIVQNSTLSLKSSGFVGGIAGEVSGSSQGKTWTNVKVAKSTIKDNAQDTNSAVGGLIGYANTSQLTLTSCSTETSNVIGYYIVGGLVGKGAINITSSTNGAIVSAYHNTGYILQGTGMSLQVNIEELLEDDKSKIYAGGIIGYMTGGTISGTNSASVSAGAVESYTDGETTKNYAIAEELIPTPLEPYAGGIAGYVQSGTLDNVVSNAPVEAGFGRAISSTYDENSIRAVVGSTTGLKTSRTKTSIGSASSYAGGIVAYAKSATITNLSTGNITVKANAKTQVKIDGYKNSQTYGVLPNVAGVVGGAILGPIGYVTGPLLSVVLEVTYNYECYYISQQQEAYANGIGYFESSSVTSTGDVAELISVTGGEKIEFNAYWTDGAGLDWVTRKSNFYILDYGIISATDENPSYYSAWVAYEDWYSVFGGAKNAWLEATQNGIKRVAFGKDSTNDKYNAKYQQAYYTTYGAGGYYEGFSSDDDGKPIYTYTDSMGNAQRLHYNENGQLGTYSRSYNDLTGGFGDWEFTAYHGSYEPEYLYDENATAELNPNYNPAASAPPSNQNYTSKTTNLDVANDKLVGTGGLKGSLLYSGNGGAFAGTIHILKAKDSNDANDKYFHLDGKNCNH